VSGLAQRRVDGVLLLSDPDRNLDEALRALESDLHNWGYRPCPTCSAITAALGRPFGCDNPEVNRSGK